MKIDYSIEVLEAELKRLNLALEPQKQKVSNILIDETKTKIKDIETGISTLQVKKLMDSFDD
jgi:hypothetical protein